MTIAMPDDIAAFLATADSDAWAQLAGAASFGPVVLDLPKWEAATTADLSAPLTALGLTVPGGDYPGDHGGRDGRCRRPRGEHHRRRGRHRSRRRHRDRHGRFGPGRTGPNPSGSSSTARTCTPSPTSPAAPSSLQASKPTPPPDPTAALVRFRPTRPRRKLTKPTAGCHRLPRPLSFNTYSDAGWSSPVARRAHNPKVAGSNPAPATNWKARKHCVSGPSAFSGSLGSDR